MDMNDYSPFLSYIVIGIILIVVGALIMYYSLKKILDYINDDNEFHYYSILSMFTKAVFFFIGTMIIGCGTIISGAGVFAIFYNLYQYFFN